MSPHDPDQNQALDEIQAFAASAASFFLNRSDIAAEDTYFDPNQRQTAVAACTIAAALCFQAERQVDAADRIRDGLLAVADQLQALHQPKTVDHAADTAGALQSIAKTFQRGVAALDLFAPPHFKGRPARFKE